MKMRSILIKLMILTTCRSRGPLMFFTKAGIANSQTLGMHVYTLETGYGLEQSITTLSVPVGDFPPHVDTGNLFYCFDLLRNDDNEKNERGAANCTQPKLLSAPSQSKVSFNDSSQNKENWTKINPLPLSTAHMSGNEGAKRQDSRLPE